ncbi:thiol reductant ABC exporter subunit CydD [Devosia sp. SD17-2]|uniref:thiol reductant ABC exporter subunit CydD n=1 Tax=Devosia sp. SD17-2 TaxID=2976459 RepID=UPI0023D8B568|nr:thiol reductant ABC exporter subunit CydD [Devosia sp. SD17-2]WEJ32419.1 thiol reductant ABC exporter subunit CydD [Devosia sp. SD17-2]
MTPEEKAAGKALSRLQKHGAQTLWLAIAAPLLGGFLLVWQAWELASVLGRAIEGGEAPQALLPGIGLVLALLITRAGLSALGDWLGSLGAEAIKLKLRELLFTGLLSRSPRQGDAASSGAATAAIVDQVEAIDAYYARYLPASAQAALLPLVFGAIILPLDWVAGVLFIVTAPLIPLFMALVGWGAQKASDHQAQALTRLSGRFGDRLRGLVTLKLFGRAEAETEAIVAASDALRQRTLKVLRIAFLSSAVLEFFAALGVAGVALYLGLTFIEFLNLRSSPLNLHIAVFLLLMAPEVYNPLRLLASHYHDRAAAKAAHVEIERQLGELPEAAAKLSDVAPRSGPTIAIAFENLTLRTPDRQKIVLHDVGLDIAAGAHVALLGPSGEGKTTLLEAIAALRTHDGQIRLEGKLLADWPEADLRARTFLLTQKPRLIHASIADNIALARPGASRSEIEQAAELAFVTPFADALADGLDTMISEDGLGLSGGQAQRVALARVFLRDAGLILLDEPTAHLDPALEGEIIDNIIAYARGRTLVVSTHSAAVAARLDKAWRIAGESLLPVAIPAKKKGAA